MNNTYRITITKTETVKTLTRREWVKGGPDESRGASDGYGYTPQIPETREETTEVLDLRVKNLDVASVINAILDNSDTA